MGEDKQRGRIGVRRTHARSWVTFLGVLVLVASAVGLAGCSADSSGASPTTEASSSRITTITLTSPTYRPKAPPGTTDDYHCTLLNPHLKENSYVISSQFFPRSP
jgi:hypothetical protein